MTAGIHAIPASTAPRTPARRTAAQVAAAALVLLTLAGCAQFSPDGGLGPAERVATERFGARVQMLRSDEDRRAIDAEVERLLAGPLDAETAVKIALLNSPGLQAGYARLGIAEADLVQAGRLPNPVLSWMKVDNSAGDSKREGVLLFDLWSLALMPLAREVETRRFEAAQLEAAAETGRVALEARSAWYEAVAARQSERQLADVVEAAEIARDLSVRMARVGNWSQTGAVHKQLRYAQAVAGLERARQRSVAARERLVRALGFMGPRADLLAATPARFPERLPELPQAIAGADGIESSAMRQRLDIAAARANLDGTARALGLTSANRFISLLELGPAQVREGDHDWMRGYELELSIPLFDWGGARVAKAESLYMQAASNAARLAVDARSEVRETWQAYRSAWELARHYRDEILPLRQRVSDERLLKYNGMLIGVFELLDDAGDKAVSIDDAIAAQRDFWLADVRMQAAMLGVAPFGGSGAAAGPATSAVVAGVGNAH